MKWRKSIENNAEAREAELAYYAIRNKQTNQLTVIIRDCDTMKLNQVAENLARRGTPLYPDPQCFVSDFLEMNEGKEILEKEERTCMAKIIKTNIQEAALKVIRENIKILTGINAVLNSRKNNSRILVIAGKRKVSLPVEQSFRDNILKKIRKKMVVQTEALARKNAIKLDEEDIAVLKNIDEEGLGKDTFNTKETFKADEGRCDDGNR